MSIQNEINRINSNVQETLQTIADTGVSVGTNSDALPSAAAALANNKANIDSPAFTGTPKAPTAAAGTNTTQVATTAFVQSALGGASQDKIGDIKTTARTDLGSDWLLCDGSAFSGDDYPELVGLCGPDVSNATFEERDPIWTDTVNLVKINKVLYADGYWVAAGKRYAGSTTYACIAYSTSVDGPWTTVDLWSLNDTTNHPHVADVAYANGYWVVAGQRNYTNQIYYGCIAYATTPDGTWTTKDILNDGTSNSRCSLGRIIYANGYWVVAGRSTNRLCISYSTTPDGTWTTKTIANSSSSGATALVYLNGYWAIGAWYWDSWGGYWCGVFYSTSLDGTWSSWSYYSGSAPSGNTVGAIAYINNKWIYLCYTTSSTSFYMADNLAQSGNATSWTTGSSYQYRDLIFDRGYYIVCGRIGNTPACLYGKSFGKSVALTEVLLPTTSTSQQYATSATVAGGRIVFVKSDINSSSKYCAELCVSKSEGVLPAIDLGVPSYIKAL